MRDYEEVISTIMDILSYWCDSPELKNTLQALPREVYSLSLSSRLNLSRLVLHYSEDHQSNRPGCQTISNNIERKAPILMNFLNIQ